MIHHQCGQCGRTYVLVERVPDPFPGFCSEWCQLRHRVNTLKSDNDRLRDAIAALREDCTRLAGKAE